MPFRPQVFQEHVAGFWQDPVPQGIAEGCARYAVATTPRRKAQCVKELMDILDRDAEQGARRSVMEACGRQCIGTSILAAGRRTQKDAQGLDDLLDRLNQAHIGGGHLWRDSDGVHASYDRCYCGSVSKSPDPFSATYCYCSCGWFKQLFESLLERPVAVDLLSSIIQGSETCTFLILV
jgi:predicted hydrocarbon binding protein